MQFIIYGKYILKIIKLHQFNDSGSFNPIVGNIGPFGVDEQIQTSG